MTRWLTVFEKEKNHTKNAHKNTSRLYRRLAVVAVVVFVALRILYSSYKFYRHRNEWKSPNTHFFFLFVIFFLLLFIQFLYFIFAVTLRTHARSRSMWTEWLGVSMICKYVYIQKLNIFPAAFTHISKMVYISTTNTATFYGNCMT